MGGPLAKTQGASISQENFKYLLFLYGFIEVSFVCSMNIYSNFLKIEFS